jgi:hypothetical protein
VGRKKMPGGRRFEAGWAGLLWDGGFALGNKDSEKDIHHDTQTLGKGQGHKDYPYQHGVDIE